MMDVDSVGRSSGAVDDPNGSSAQNHFDQTSYKPQGKVGNFQFQRWYYPSGENFRSGGGPRA